MPMDHMVPYLVFDRYIGSGKWSKVSLWLHSNDSSLCGPFPLLVRYRLIGPAPMSMLVVRFAAFWSITSLWSWAGEWPSISISAEFV